MYVYIYIEREIEQKKKKTRCRRSGKFARGSSASAGRAPPLLDLLYSCSISVIIDIDIMIIMIMFSMCIINIVLDVRTGRGTRPRATISFCPYLL